MGLAQTMGRMMIKFSEIDPNKPVLIYGPTASGKSGLALKIARHQGGIIINADALQIYRGWEVLTAQPPATDQALAPHYLYGHLPPDAPYSVGDWLRDVVPMLNGERAIIVGGTGLYFTALTEGLADIPPTSAAVRARADALPLPDLIAALDPQTYARIDLQNRARVQRAWEVQEMTGRSITDWQAATPPPLMPLEACTALALMPDVDWLNARITARFDMMLQMGAEAEARAMLPRWTPQDPASKAIGAQEMIDYVSGAQSLQSTRDAIVIATRRYAKRQRTWLRSRMKAWRRIDLPDLGDT